MNILIVSSWAGTVALADRLQKEGHNVRMYVKHAEYRKVGDGFVKKVSSWEPLKKQSDLIIFDYTGFGKESEACKKEGLPVWGGTAWSDEIELDRGKGQAFLKEAGMKIIPSKDFSGLEEAIAFVKSNPKRYVVKPSGPIQDEKALTYCGKEEDGSDMVSVLTHYKEKWSSKITKVELQEFQKGIEVAASSFFNGSDFLEPIEVSFEHKKLMNGNIGPSTGEMGTSMVWMNKNKLYRETIGKVIPFLKKNQYTGYFDINCIATEKNIWPLEITARFGYPTIQLKMETIKENLGNLMQGIVRGRATSFKVSNPYSICVVIPTPPYPFSSKDIYKKYGEDQEVICKDKSQIQPGEVLKEGDRWFLTGCSGFSLICTGQGKSLKEAKAMAYKRVESVTLPNSFYRTDISDKTEEQLKTLNSWGWFKN